MSLSLVRTGGKSCMGFHMICIFVTLPHHPASVIWEEDFRHRNELLIPETSRLVSTSDHVCPVKWISRLLLLQRLFHLQTGHSVVRALWAVEWIRCHCGSQNLNVGVIFWHTASDFTAQIKSLRLHEIKLPVCRPSTLYQVRFSAGINERSWYCEAVVINRTHGRHG